MKRNYKFTGEKISTCGTILNQIIAIKDFNNGNKTVRKGALGGWIEKFENLSGNAWINDGVWVYGDARVFGNACIYGNATIHGKTKIYGDTRYNNIL